jgi:hypothetical protein
MNSYHFRALSQDVGYRWGCIAGRGNIDVVLKEIAQREKLADVPGLAKAKVAAEQLMVYFEELCAGMGPEACELAKRQEVGGEMLDGANAELLTKAEKKSIRTTTDKSAAKRLADAFGARGVDW